MKYRLLVFLFAIPFFSSAQLLDTIKTALKQKPKFFFELGGYNSIITGTKANASGFKIGLDFGKKIRFGAGYFVLNTDIVERFSDVIKDDTVRAELKSNYFTVGAEYVMYNNDPWQITVPADLGFGKSYFLGPDSVTGKTFIHKGGIILFEPAITGHYKIIKWVGIGFGFGYRFMLKNNPSVRDNFNSPLYTLYIKFFVDEIYNSIFVKKKKENSTSSEK
jgi:hypothetical protein